MDWILHLDVRAWDLNCLELDQKINVYFVVQLSIYKDRLGSF